MRHGREGEGAEILEFPQEPREPTDSGEVTIPGRSGSMLAALRAIAGDLGVKTASPSWPTEVAVAVRKALVEARRAEGAHRETLRQVAAALEGREAPDPARSAFVVSPAKLLEVARRLHGDLARKDALMASVSETNAQLQAELAALKATK